MRPSFKNKHLFWSRLLYVAISPFFLAGCDFGSNKFELLTLEHQTYLLNKESGETWVVEGMTLDRVQSIDAVRAAGAGKTMHKTWPVSNIPQLGNLTVNVETTYRDGQMLYKVNIAPFKGTLEKAQSMAYPVPTFALTFSDHDGFDVRHVNLPVNGVNGPTRVVNEKGEPFALLWKGELPLSRETYEALGATEVGWAGFPNQ